MDINVLEKKRDKLAHQARAILTEAQEDDGRDLTPEEEQEFDRIMDEVDTQDARIKREKRAREAERAAAEEDEREAQPGDGDEREPEEVAMRAFNRYLRDGVVHMTEEEQRALQVTPDNQGGFLVVPQQFMNALIEAVDDQVVIRNFATGHQLTEAESLGVPTRESDIDDFEWTTELGTGSEDDGPTFGKREFRPHPMAKRIKISRTLLRKSSRDPESIVRERLSYKLGVTQERAYMTGDGSQKPLGLFTASPDGIPTSRDVAIGTGGAIPLTTATSDQLIDAKYTLKEQYWNRARWLFHRDLIKIYRKLKDGDGNYLWVPGLANGRPDTILEVPYTVSEFAPNTVSANAYVGMIGDFSNYWYVDTLSLEIQRLVELYAETNQVGFIARYEGDGMPVLAEAFVRLQVAA